MTTENLIASWDKVYANRIESREEIQRLLILTAIDLSGHGNINVVKHAIDKQPDGDDKKAFADWINAHMPVDVEYNARTKEHDVIYRKGTTKEQAVAMLNAGKEKKWWKFATKSGFKGYDLDAELNRVLTSAHNAMKKRTKLIEAGQTDVAEVKVNLSKLAAIRAALALPDEVPAEPLPTIEVEELDAA